jgi:hypothetical protein
LAARRVACRSQGGDAGQATPDDSGSGAGDKQGDDAGSSSSSYLLPWETEARALPPGYAAIAANVGAMDSNQLQTALGVAIAAEDYALAGR